MIPILCQEKPQFRLLLIFQQLVYPHQKNRTGPGHKPGPSGNPYGRAARFDRIVLLLCRPEVRY